MAFEFIASHTNTGASTLNIGGGILPLVRDDGTALVAGDIIINSVVSGNYIHSIDSFKISNVVKSQVADITDAALANKVTGSETIHITYDTNSAGKGYVLAGDEKGDVRLIEMSRLIWLSYPIGSLLPIAWQQGAVTPPISDPDFRWVLLSYNNPAYNAGALIDEQVDSSGVLLTASAVISDARSPMNGQRISLINTGRVMIRPGYANVEYDALQNITGYIQAVSMSYTDYSVSGALNFSNIADTGFGSQGGFLAGVKFNASQSPGVRTADETRMKNIGYDFFMRIA